MGRDKLKKMPVLMTDEEAEHFVDTEVLEGATAASG